MVMPFNRKPVPDRGEIDFDKLWDKAFAPLLRDLGYDPIRADQDLGASILADMLIRLTASDLVVVDLALANANVYYEAGVRHAARDAGCVMVAPDWAKPVFDLQQVRFAAYPLPLGELTDEAAVAIRAALAEPVRHLAAGRSPVFQLVPGYPGDLPESDNADFQAFVGHLTEFQSEVAAVRAAPAGQRAAMVEALLERHPLARPQSPAIVLELVRVVRDERGFERLLAFIEQLPEALATRPDVLEQQGLALGKTGRQAEAVGKLEQLVATYGPDPERHGLLGGRFKELWRAAVAAGDRLEARRYLTKAIDSYSAGMWLDLNEYYCSCNLARLLQARNGPGDIELSRLAGEITLRACERAQQLGKHDEWLSATLLGAAFDAADVEQVERLLDRVIAEGAARWQLAATIGDLKGSLAAQQAKLDEDVASRLADVLATLDQMAGPGH
jgi:hypothetical protein